MPRRYILRNPRRKRSAGETLLRFLMSRGGSATKLEISRHSADGKLLAQAVPELADLIAVEDSRSARSKRPATRVSLTLKGLAAAQALRADWQPRRLATDILKRWFDELASERNAWAAGLLRDADDAAHWRHHEKQIKERRIVCGPPKPKARPRGCPFVAQGVNGPSTLDRKIIPPPRQTFAPTPTTNGGHIPFTDAERQVIGLPEPTVATPAEDWHCRRCGYCRRCTMNSEICRCGKMLHSCGREQITTPTYYQGNTPTEPTAHTPPSDSGLSAKIKAAGFQTNASGDVLYGGKWISPDEWQRKMPHVRL